ncbi:hypothetical protein GCM10010276_16820 [Streptomyces longisporus]|uniref:Secreted protein n=1 Tax=Streptomyces longisporus TaxID=1948 RepID=A0ABN3LAM7_STRLO
MLVSASAEPPLHAAVATAASAAAPPPMNVRRSMLRPPRLLSGNETARRPHGFPRECHSCVTVEGDTKKAGTFMCSPRKRSVT